MIKLTKGHFLCYEYLGKSSNLYQYSIVGWNIKRKINGFFIKRLPHSDFKIVSRFLNRTDGNLVFEIIDINDKYIDLKINNITICANIYGVLRKNKKITKIKFLKSGDSFRNELGQFVVNLYSYNELLNY